MRNYIKVEGHENLYRDSSTGAIINKEIPSKNKLSTTVNAVVDDLNNLKNEISEIKSLLKSIVENGIRS
jgi:predicted transcriptional regulator